MHIGLEKLCFLENQFGVLWRIISSYVLLNPQSRYIEVDAYLLQNLCHVTSNVKLPYLS